MRRQHSAWARAFPRQLGLALVCTGLVIPQPAEAHVIIEGVTGFASLVLHPFAAVDTILVILALALAVGANERPAVVAACFLPAIAGGLIGSQLQDKALLLPGLWRLPLVMGLAMGLLGASGRAAGTWGSLAITLLAGIAIGLGLVPEAPGLTGRLEAGAAGATAIVLGLIVVAWPRSLSRHPVLRIGGRVIAAWIVAIAALGLSVSLRR